MEISEFITASLEQIAEGTRNAQGVVANSTVYGATLTATQMTPPYATIFLANWVGSA